MVAGAGGHPAAVEEHFETAVRQAQEMGAATELADASYWYARSLLEQGRVEDRERARGLLAEASQIWERTGMPKQLDKARRLGASANGA